MSAFHPFLPRPLSTDCGHKPGMARRAVHSHAGAMSCDTDIANVVCRTLTDRPVTDDQVLENMRARVAQCRRLAKLIHNPEAVRMLLEMAEDGEADIKKLEGERTGS